MSSEAAFVRSWRVGPFEVELSCPRPKPGLQCHAVMQWKPHQPERLSEQQLGEYRAGRNAALRDLAQELGIAVAVVDL